MNAEHTDGLTNKIVWITGASSGIGEALARECFARGARLVLSARNRKALELLSEGLIAGGEGANRSGEHTEGGSAQSPPLSSSRIYVRPLDVTDGDEIGAAASEISSRFGRVDLLIHAAGVSQRARAAETTLAVARRIMETNFFGVVALTQALLPALLAAGCARVVVVSSVFGKFGAPGRSAYAASKHALHGYFDSLRCELPGTSVRFTLVVPGAVATKISEHALTADGSQTGVADKGIAEGMSPERCAKKIVRAVLQGRDELRVAIGMRAGFALVLKQVAPRLLTRILRTARIT